MRPKKNPPLAFLASTGGRPAYIITKEMIEQLRETGMNWRSIATCLGISNTIQTWDRVRGGEQFHRNHDIATNWQTYGIDYDGPLTDIETDNNVVVPESQIQLAK